MNYRYVVSAFMVLLILPAVACASKQASSPQIQQSLTFSQQGMESRAVYREDWEVKWESAVKDAKKEGKVVVYGLANSEAFRNFAPQFSKKYGFNLEAIISGRGAEMTAKIFTERRAGLFIPDIYVSGTNTFFGVLKPAGLGDPLDTELILPEVLNPGLWYGGKLPWGDEEHLLFMSLAYPNASVAINIQLVKQAEIRSYYDLLNPKWKGKILMNDPTIAGTGQKGFSVLGFGILDLDFFRHLAAQEPVIIRDQRLQVDWLAKGKYPVLLFPRTAPMTEYKEAGASIDYVSLVEGTYMSVGGGNIALINKAPHPNAAKIFINWFLSREGQSFYTSFVGAQSARIDVPTKGLDPFSIRQSGAKYFLDSDKEWWVSRDAEYVRVAQEIFGHLISR